MKVRFAVLFVFFVTTWKSHWCVFGVILESKFSPFVDVSHPDSLESQSIRNRFVTLSRLIVTELASQKKKKIKKKIRSVKFLFPPHLISVIRHFSVAGLLLGEVICVFNRHVLYRVPLKTTEVFLTAEDKRWHENWTSRTKWRKDMAFKESTRTLSFSIIYSLLLIS